MTERDQLDAICREAFARLDALDLQLYQRGFLGKPQNAWGKRSIPIDSEPPKKKGKDIGGTLVKSPVPLPTLSPQGATRRA